MFVFLLYSKQRCRPANDLISTFVIDVCEESGFTVKPVLNRHSKDDQNRFLRGIIAYCRSKLLQNAPMEHSAILLTCIKVPHGFMAFVLSIFEWLLKTGFTVHVTNMFFCSLCS